MVPTQRTNLRLTTRTLKTRRADGYDCDTEVDVTIDENTLMVDTLTMDDDCSGDATLTDEGTVSARRRFDGLSVKL